MIVCHFKKGPNYTQLAHITCKFVSVMQPCTCVEEREALCIEINSAA